MSKAIYAGSFDPVTVGHIDIIKRSLNVVDHLVIGVGDNIKKRYLFDAKTRLNLLQESLKDCIDMEKVTIKFFNNLLVDFAKEEGASILIRGIRAFSDFDYEYQIALTNQDLSENIETVFLIARPEFIFVSSSTVKEIAHFKKDVSKYVTKIVKDAIEEKFK